jgi:hypothetical protein
MMHPIASQAVARERQRDILKVAEGQRRVRMAFNAQERVRQTEVPLARCGQTRRANRLVKDHLS